MTIATKTWRLGPGNGRRAEADASDGDGDEREAKPLPESKALDASKLLHESKMLAKSKASVAEGERMLARQIAVLSELRADGLITTEAEKSVARLETALLAQRAAHDGLVAKALAMDGPATEGVVMSN